MSLNKRRKRAIERLLWKMPVKWQTFEFKVYPFERIEEDGTEYVEGAIYPSFSATFSGKSKRIADSIKGVADGVMLGGLHKIQLEGATIIE